ncbi:MAG: hypothetical protein NHB14_22415 [Desulfosporosinus sp.]|nr:hypothetical protein [Desulfosporosinus sp.]
MGELDSTETSAADAKEIKVAVCHDFVSGSIEEKLIWNFLGESLPASVRLDKYIVGSEGDYTENARRYIEEHFPKVEVILQNATFMNTIDESRYTIAFLQDDLRSMGMPNVQQEGNLRQADKLVTNSIQTALSYPACDFEIISGGVDLDSMQRWQSLLTAVFKELMLKKLTLKEKSGIKYQSL